MAGLEEASASKMATLPDPPVHASLAELAVDWITAAIIAGDIKPGDKLTEVALAEAAGMSRSPIREALRTLSRQGLVSIEPRRATTVAVLSARDVADLYDCRLLIEPRCMALAAPEVTPAVAEVLETCFERMTAAAHEDKGRAYHAAVTEYNRALQECCPNKVLVSMTSAALSSSLRYTAILVRSSQQYLLLSLGNNRKRHDAVTARDMDAVAEAASAVLVTARAQLLKLIDSIPASPGAQT